MAETNEIKEWIVQIQEGEDNDLYIQLTDDIIDITGLYVGENLIWELLGDDTFVLRRSDDYDY